MLIQVSKLKMNAFQNLTSLPSLHFHYIHCSILLLASVPCSSLNSSVISTPVAVGQEIGLGFAYHKAMRQKHAEQHWRLCAFPKRLGLRENNNTLLLFLNSITPSASTAEVHVAELTWFA